MQSVEVRTANEDGGDEKNNKHNVNKQHQAQEVAYLQTLDSRNSNISGVNLDQEMSDLIRIQSAYTAAAKMISVAQKMLDDLMAAFR